MEKLRRMLLTWMRPDWPTILFGVVLSVCVWCGAWWQIEHEREMTLAAIRQDGQRLTRAFEEHVRSVLKKNEFYLDMMKAEYELSYKLTPGLERLLAQLDRDPIADAGIADASGRFVISTLANAERVNIASVPYFAYHMEAKGENSYIGEPFVGRVSQKTSLHMTRRINLPDGSFGGVAIIAMDPDYFTGFYRDMGLPEHYTIRIVGLDGIVRASNEASELKADMHGSDLFRVIDEAAEGFYLTNGLIFGRTLAVSYRTMADYPLIVQVGVSNAAWGDFEHRRQVYLGVACGLSLSILGFAALIIARARAKRQEERRLRTVVANTPIIFYALDQTGVFTFCEGLGLKKLGFDSGEAVGQSVFDRFCDYPEVLEQVRRALGGEAVFFEHKVLDMYLNNRLLPLLDERGQVIAVVGAAVDITERVLVQQRLQSSFEQIVKTHGELLAAEEELRLRCREIDQANWELVSQNAVLEALREMTAKMMLQTDLQQLLQIIIAWATASVGTRHGNIALLDEQEGVMESLVGAGLLQEHAGVKLPLDRGVAGRVYRTGQPVVVENYSELEDSVLRPDLQAVRCYVGVPLKHENRVIGAIGVAFTDERHCLGGNELARLMRFAELASIAVEKVRKMEALCRSQQMATALFNAASEVLVVYDWEKAEILSVNRRILQLFGYDESEWEAEKFSFGLDGIDQTELLRLVQIAVRQEQGQFTELESHDCAGRRLVLEIGVAPVAIDGQTRCLVSMRDTTARKQMEEGLAYLRLRDPLTGVYNRAYFEAALVRTPSGKPAPTGIFVCDVDGLKLINDTLGHRNGDELLKRVAGILTDAIETPNYVARIGGDEFAVVLRNVTKAQMGELDQHYRSLVANYNAEHPQLPLSLSLGWAWRDEEVTDTNLETLFKTADNFMYRQKMHQSHSVRGSIVRTLMQALEARDRITEGHAERLSSLMEKMGRRLALPNEVISDLRLLAKFHDIGKVGIPDSILKKPGRLTADEFAIMRQHCEIGFRIAKSSPDLEPIADWILKHHEHWNGKGYPLGLSKEAIPIQCRILGIVDAYDAMTGERPYQEALTSEAAIEEIRRCAGTQFDPALAAVFIALLSEEAEEETYESACGA